MFYGLKINDRPPRVFPLTRETLEALIDGDETQLRLPCGLTLPALDQAQEARMREHDEGLLSDEEYEQKLTLNKKSRPYICTCDFVDGIRNNKNAQWAGFVAHDFDHIGSEECRVKSEKFVTPTSIYEERIKGHEQEWGIVAVFISPSFHGLKLISRIGKNEDIAKAQEAMAKWVGLECDKHTKDIARATYLVSRDRWLYLDLEGMFTKTEENFRLMLTDECGMLTDRPSGVVDLKNDDLAGDKSAPIKSTIENSTLGQSPNQVNNQQSTLNTYNGFPMKTIVDEWWEQHGKPEVGSRHAAIYQLAYNLKFICENDPKMTFEAIKTSDTFGKPDDEVFSICKDACEKRTDHLYMPKELRAVIDGAMLNVDCGMLNDRPNQLNNQHSTLNIEHLPIGIADSLANVPAPMHMPIIASLLPLMGAYADGVRARYADGKMHPLALMSIVVGEMASGKSQCKDIADVWLEKMREQDAEQRRIEREWREQNKGKKANEKGKPDPGVTIIEVPITISCSTLLKRLMYSRGHIIYSFEEELDTLRKTNSAGNWSAKYDIYRKAFDHSMWGQDYNSDQATSGMARVAYNFSILGTYGAFRKCFKGESVENGLASRIIIAEMPDNRFAKLKMQKELTQEQCENIHKAVKILRNAKGDLDLPKLRYMMEEWVEDKRIEALKNADDLKDAFRKRAAVIGFRAGVVYFLLENKSEERRGKNEELEVARQENSSLLTLNSSLISDSCVRFAQTIAQYTLDEQMRMFGEQFLQAEVDNEKCQYGTGNQELLDSLPKVFTFKDLQKLKGTSKPRVTIYQTIRRWIANELVVKRDEHSWEKT